MKKYTFVKWITKDGKRGFGQVITDEDNGRVQVAVHSWDSPHNPPIPLESEELEVHPVIYCTITWLTIVST